MSALGLHVRDARASIAACSPSTAQRIGARHDHEVADPFSASTAALTRSTISDLRDELFARPVAAALRADLVLDVHRARAELDRASAPCAQC